MPLDWKLTSEGLWVENSKDYANFQLILRDNLRRGRARIRYNLQKERFEFYISPRYSHFTRHCGSPSSYIETIVNDNQKIKGINTFHDFAISKEIFSMKDDYPGDISKKEINQIKEKQNRGMKEFLKEKGIKSYNIMENGGVNNLSFWTE